AVDTGFVAHAQLYTRNEVLPVSTFDAAKCERLYRRLARNRSWAVPTLVVHRAFASLGDSAFRADPRLADMPAAYRMFWGFSRSDPAYRAAYEQHLRTVGAMHRAGVPILAGTDVLNPYIFPGYSLHDELELLARAGLSPLDALRTATLNPARYLGRADSLGTVAAGKLADLVLLDADPLADVRNTRRIRAVVAGGRYLDRAALDRLVAEAREAGKAPPSWP
ncbi:MAG TPA: amidohydrolase family protein, partial [Longimicrobiaceae bacterium]